MNNSTLTRKLFFRITPTILVTIVAIGGFAFHSATREIDNMYDAQLINDANILWRLLENELGEKRITVPKKVDDIDFTMDNQLAFNIDADDYADAHMFRAWQSGKVLMYSSTAFSTDIPQQKGGFSNVMYTNENWRVYTLPVPNTSVVIEVGEKTALRNTLVSNILLNLFFPLFVLVPVIAGLIWFGINNGLGTIRALVQQIRSRSPDDLSAIPVDDLPRDLSPLGKSINQLLEKLEHSLTAERRFADHAAHQLRTPQAGLKLLLQMLAKADNDEERKAIISDLMASNERATQLIEQLLRAARVGHQPITLQTVYLYQVAASVIAEMGNMATQKRLDIVLEGSEKANIRADESLLRLLIANLIDNAIKFTSYDGSIQVDIAPTDGMWRLSISDTGSGIPESQREAVFQRFYRVDAPHADGTGLGLAIVAEIVERFNGNITLKTPVSGKGLLVEVLLPKA
jgi:two-component system, OmpR family, sensor histidine kinase QseC